MKAPQKWLSAFGIIVFSFCQPVSANPSTDIKSYSAAVDTNDWKAAFAAAERLIHYPSETLPLTSAERTELLSVTVEAAARAGETTKAISLSQKLVATIEANDGPISYALVAPLRKLAELLSTDRQLQAAAAIYDRAVALSESEFGNDNIALLPIYLARHDVSQKRLAAAIKNRSDDVNLVRLALANQITVIDKLREIANNTVPINNTVKPRGLRNIVRTRELDGAAFQLVTVHYGTNRNFTGQADPAQFYGVQRGPLLLGTANVSVPKVRSIGEIPQPQRWRADFRPDAAKHFILTTVAPSTSPKEFVASARAQLDQSRRREALVFIHGFNSDFQDSVFRSAQLAVDLNIDGAVFMYDWPSKGSIFSYVADGAEVIRPMVRSLRNFLDIVVRETGAEHVHIVAHSMGNRYLIEALELMSRETARGLRKPLFDQLVFAAPDVDAEDFSERVTEIGWMAQRMTLYVSSKDRALELSSTINGGYRRAGDAEAAIVVAGLDTIDTTDVSAGGLGHIDFVDRALDDLRAIVWLSLQPSSRCLLVKKSMPTGTTLWRLSGAQISNCHYKAFQSAILLERDLGSVGAVKYVRGKLDTARAQKDASTETFYSEVLTLFNVVK